LRLGHGWRKTNLLPAKRAVDLWSFPLLFVRRREIGILLVYCRQQTGMQSGRDLLQDVPKLYPVFLSKLRDNRARAIECYSSLEQAFLNPYGLLSIHAPQIAN